MLILIDGLTANCVSFMILSAGRPDYNQEVNKRQKRNGAMQEIPGSSGVLYQSAVMTALLENIQANEVLRLPSRLARVETSVCRAKT